MTSHPTRRDVLLRSAGIGAVALTGATGQATAVDESTTDEIPAPFDDLPTIDDPADEQRQFAELTLPPRALPETGPIPDYRRPHITEIDVVLPEWVVESVRYQLQDYEDPERSNVLDAVLDVTEIRPRYRMPDGRDALDVLLADARAENEGDVVPSVSNGGGERA